MAGKDKKSLFQKSTWEFIAVISLLLLMIYSLSPNSLLGPLALLIVPIAAIAAVKWYVDSNLKDYAVDYEYFEGFCKKMNGKCEPKLDAKRIYSLLPLLFKPLICSFKRKNREIKAKLWISKSEEGFERYNLALITEMPNADFKKLEEETRKIRAAGKSSLSRALKENVSGFAGIGVGLPTKTAVFARKINSKSCLVVHVKSPLFNIKEQLFTPKHAREFEECIDEFVDLANQIEKKCMK
jgi:hypothetical protein